MPEIVKMAPGTGFAPIEGGGQLTPCRPGGPGPLRAFVRKISEFNRETHQVLFNESISPGPLGCAWRGRTRRQVSVTTPSAGGYGHAPRKRGRRIFSLGKHDD